MRSCLHGGAGAQYLSFPSDPAQLETTLSFINALGSGVCVCEAMCYLYNCIVFVIIACLICWCNGRRCYIQCRADAILPQKQNRICHLLSRGQLSSFLFADEAQSPCNTWQLLAHSRQRVIVNPTLTSCRVTWQIGTHSCVCASAPAPFGSSLMLKDSIPHHNTPRLSATAITRLDPMLE